ncbi:MAG: hypothetical protein MJ181_11490 [Treponema sp.]|nr:hypothetical protein [Treponema sp.]
MLKCLECKNYIRTGNRHRCACYSGITVFVAGYPNEPIKEDCGCFEKIKFRTNTTSQSRKGGQK